MPYAPVALFIYNRKNHFEKTVTALSRCPEAKDTELFLFSDAARTDADSAHVAAVRRLAREIEKSGWFRCVHIIENAENRGLAASVIGGVTQTLSAFGRVIVLEDDCVPCPSFLRYMNRCLSVFEADQRIGSVSGYAPAIRFPKDYDKDIFTAYRSCSWGWATWTDRWSDVDWDVSDFRQLCADNAFVRRMNLNGNDRFIRLYRQVNGAKDSWSVKFGCHLVRRDQLTVYPRYSYIENIGVDNSGVHSRADDAAALRVDIGRAVENPQIFYAAPDRAIQKQLSRVYGGSAAASFKRALATRAIRFKERLSAVKR